MIGLELVKEIYDQKMLDTKQSKETREMELQIVALAQNIEGADEAEEEYIQGLFFEAGKKGQRYGFIQGFKYAVVLMAECFN